ncbi:MAG: LarC family nickel insertion protein [Kiritimatiellae bacterium]|nr:LarC family nickel insertion protein [Kiritimatiellia bacterium]
MLYIEGAAGISGDMTVGALLSLGASREKLKAVLDSLKLGDEFSYVISEKASYGIAGTDFDVILPHRHHHHEHGHHHHHHHHEHRNLADVESIIDRGEMSDRARSLAKKAFRFVAEAEAKAHGKPLDEVHFHEVGAIDSIVDIVSAAVLFDDLGETECVVTGLTEGSGTVMCAHGELPVPVPAVLNIAAATGVPLRVSDVKGECVTPTGIALAAAFRTREALPAAYRVKGVGIGLGKRDYGRPAILRIMKIEAAE